MVVQLAWLKHSPAPGFEWAARLSGRQFTACRANQAKLVTSSCVCCRSQQLLGHGAGTAAAPWDRLQSAVAHLAGTSPRASISRRASDALTSPRAPRSGSVTGPLLLTNTCIKQQAGIETSLLQSGVRGLYRHASAATVVHLVPRCRRCLQTMRTSFGNVGPMPLRPAGVSRSLIAAAQRLSGAVSEDHNSMLADGHDGGTGSDLTAPLLSHAIEAVEEEPAVRFSTGVVVIISSMLQFTRPQMPAMTWRAEAAAFCANTALMPPNPQHVLQGQSDDVGDDGFSQADDSERALLALVGSIGRGLWYAGFLAVPAALFWAGVSVFDALHGAYLLLLLGGLLHYTLQLYPAVSSMQQAQTLVAPDSMHAL